MANSVSPIDIPNNVIVTTQEGNTIDIPQTTTNVVTVNSIGPQGPTGPSLTTTSILTITPQHPLATDVAIGSFAVSSSSPPKPYFWDGISWNALY